MKRFIYTAFSLLFPLLALSQYYIKGQVKDDAGNPLQNVTILLHSSGYVYYSGTEGAFGIISNGITDTLSFAREGFAMQKVAVRTADFVDVKLKKLPVTKSSNVNKLASLTQNLQRDVQQQWFSGEETYASIIENGFIDASSYPATGLSLNVDRASYSNIRRFLNMNTVVPPDAVRMEELLNYFNLNYSEPTDGKTFQIKTHLTACPWNKNNQLLLAQINSKKIPLDDLPPSNLVFLIDISGSMDMPNRLPLLKSGFKSLVNNLRNVDSVAIVVYGGTVGIALNTTGGDEKEKIFRVIDSLQAGGSTPGESGVKLAYSVAKNHFIKDGNNRVILATDGDFNVGLKTEDELEEMIVAQQKSGIYLTCLGIGMGNYKDSKIQRLAQKGAGNFAYLDSYAEAEKVLLKEFTQTLYTVADDAYLNVHFNPEHVKEYRLVGFDNKVGAIRDTTSTIEGGEVGSAYSTLIAFEIVPKEATQKELQPVSFCLKYKEPGTRNVIKINEQPTIAFTPFNELPKCHQFASSVIMFGSLLRKSKFIKTSWNDLIDMAKVSADLDNYSQKEFVALVEQAKKVYSRKRRKDD